MSGYVETINKLEEKQVNLQKNMQRVQADIPDLVKKKHEAAVSKNFINRTLECDRRSKAKIKGAFSRSTRSQNI